MSAAASLPEEAARKLAGEDRTMLVGNLALYTLSTSGEEFCLSLPQAQEIMKYYPFAVAMEHGNRNLMEVIQSERLSEEPLEIIRLAAHQIAKSVEFLHSVGVAHGDM